MIFVYIHIATINNYLEILNNLLQRMETSELSQVATINICISGSNIKYFKYNSYYNGELQKFEFPTLERVRNCALKYPQSKILYVHTKGVTDPNNQCIIDWRNYMSYFVIDKYNDCLNILDEYDTCGVDLRNEPVSHYSGNFWWAKASHINKLPKFEEMPIILSERHKAEFWICSKSDKHKCLWESNINQYQRHLHKYPEENYKK